MLLAVALPARGEDNKAATSNASAIPSAADVKRADSLYQKARLLKQRGNREEACLLFGESQKLDPQGATLVNLAECHDAEGKTGTAWKELFVALKLAKKVENQDLIGAIKARLAAIVPRLCQVTVVVPKEVGAIPGVEIRMDNKVLSPGVPNHVEVVDPGQHTIQASAPGHFDFTRNVRVAGGRRQATVSVWLEKNLPPPESPNRAPMIAVGVGGGALAVASVALGIAALVGTDKNGQLPEAQVVGCITTGALALATIPILFYLTKQPPAPSVTKNRAPAMEFALQPVVGAASAGLGVSGVF